jgi:hypothetical protein
MYGGFEVYKEYLAVKNHFTSDSYDYSKYGGKVNVKLESFTKRNDRHFFHKLSKRYTEREITHYFVCNFLVSNKWVGDLLKNDGAEEYTKWKKYQDSYRYFFRNDCVLVVDDFTSNSLSFDDGLGVVGGQHPRLLRLYLRKKISFQTLYIIDRIINFSRKWDNQIEEKIVWPGVSKKLKKVRPFVQYNLVEMRDVMKDVFVNA